MTGLRRRTWIVNPYGSLPSEGWREYRSLMIARELSALGHEVTWWISDFEHRSKSYRSVADFQSSELPPNVRLSPVHCPPYEHNISLRRIKYESTFGREFFRLAMSRESPDCILLAEPSLFYARWVLKYLQSHCAVLVVDVLDLWPELFRVVLPSPLRCLDRVLFAPLYARRNALLQRADGIVFVSEDFRAQVEFPESKPTLVTYLGVNLRDFDRQETGDVSESIATFVAGAELAVVYAGTLGDAYDIATVIAAIERCAADGVPVKFVFAGDGPWRDRIEDLAERHPGNVLYVGSIPAAQLSSVYEHCDVGLCSYARGSTVSMPVKLYDYLAAGLCVVNSLDGEIQDLLNRHTCGIKYESESSDSLYDALMRAVSSREYVAHCKGSARRLAESFDAVKQHETMARFIDDLFGAVCPSGR